MKDFLCEIYTEEIPARILNDAVEQFKKQFEERLNNFRLRYNEIKSFGSPKRLLVYIKDVSEKEDDVLIEIKGPSIKISLDESGQKLPPYIKFLETNGFDEKDILVREIKGSQYIFGKKISKGRDAKEILKEITLEALKSIHFSKPMRWEETNVEFIRPIRNILLLFGSEVIDLTYAGVKSNNFTFGLFVESPMQIKINSVDEYFLKIKENYIVISFEDRKRIIKEKLSKLSSIVHGVPDYNEEFLEEVSNMNEYPTPFLCSIKLKDIKVPDCIVAGVIKDHLKSFPLIDPKFKNVLPYFISVRNGTSDFIEIVREGYERVAKARVLDGSFFFNEDKKIPFESFVEKLSDIVFLKEVGTIKDKIERLVRIADFLSTELNFSDKQKKNLKRASYLSKADLVTAVVKEFPDLQGTMGGIYAKLWDENTEVANAISEQYLPRFSGDLLPASFIGKFLSIIDKIDTLTASFISGVEYSSSKDPFGLRRLGSGIVQIAFSFDLNIFSMEKLVNFSIANFGNKFVKGTKNVEIINFLKDRASAVLKEKGIRYDVANAVSSLHIDLIPTYFERSKVIMEHIKDDKFAVIGTTYKRIKNILEKAKFNEAKVNEKLLYEKSEEELYSVICESKEKIEGFLNLKDYEAVLSMLYIVEPAVRSFFDNVLVMDENESVRNNRLSLLNNLKTIFESFADFSQLVFDNSAI
jgi:glycyl-tRNA synthetase beta chain